MTDNPLDNLPGYNRVSLRAVLVTEGDGSGVAALANAGFAEVVTVPVVIGDEADLPGGILGDGVTPNVSAVLETEEEHDHEAVHQAHRDGARPASDAGPRSSRTATTLPAAYGLQPLAPVLKVGR